MKDTKDKLPWDLLPMDAIESIVKVLDMGAKKYAPNSWMEETPEKYYAAMMRHIVAWKKGEYIDEESGLPHLAHVLCNAVFIYELERGTDYE